MNLIILNSSNPRAQFIFPSVCIIFNFFHQHCMVSEYKSFTSLGRFITRYFIKFDVIVNVSLICLSD